jgi:hypothetical protein
MSGEQLEQRYRGLLRVLPKPYREARGDELLSTLMDRAAEGRKRPELGEVVSLTRLGLRVRMRGGGAAGGVPADTRVGALARAVAITGSMLLAFVGVTQLAIWVRSIRTWGYDTWSWKHPFSVYFPGAHRFSIAGFEAPAGWLVVLALLAVGWWRAARVLALVLFLWSAYLTDGTLMAMMEETLLAGVVTAALRTGLWRRLSSASRLWRRSW